MRTMTLMAALAMLAATHSIATRTAVASDATTATAIHTFDLPAVRVYATVERAAPASSESKLAQAPRIHHLPPMRVHAVRDGSEVIGARTTTLAMRAPSARRASLAIPRGSARRGLTLQRGAPSRAQVRVDRWIAMGCMIRMRLARVWPMQHCNRSAQRFGPTSRAGGLWSVTDRDRRR